jgi:hypothetical protein
VRDIERPFAMKPYGGALQGGGVERRRQDWRFFMVFERVPLKSGICAQLAYPLAIPIHPLRFFAAQDRNLVPKFGKAGEIWQNLRPPERVGQAVISDVEHARTAPLRIRFRHRPSIAPFRRDPAHMGNRSPW